MIVISTALVVSFVGLLLANIQVEWSDFGGKERLFFLESTNIDFFLQFEGCWSLAVVTYLAIASIVSVIRTQVNMKKTNVKKVLSTLFGWKPKTQIGSKLKRR